MIILILTKHATLEGPLNWRIGNLLQKWKLMNDSTVLLADNMVAETERCIVLEQRKVRVYHPGFKHALIITCAIIEKLLLKKFSIEAITL